MKNNPHTTKNLFHSVNYPHVSKKQHHAENYLNASKCLYEEGKDYRQIDAKDIRDRVKKTAPLMAFEFQEQVKKAEHWITIESPEFTAICPFSDYPDFGIIKISYVPNKRCLELKSFKLYINAFRDIRVFHETVAEIIFADFLEAIHPRKVKIEVDMNPRGNVKTICRKFYKCS